MNSIRENHKEVIKNNELVLSHSEVLEVRNIVYLLKKLKRLYWVLMMIKEYNQSIQLKHIHMEQANT